MLELLLEEEVPDVGDVPPVLPEWLPDPELAVFPLVGLVPLPEEDPVGALEPVFPLPFDATVVLPVDPVDPLLLLGLPPLVLLPEGLELPMLPLSDGCEEELLPD